MISHYTRGKYLGSLRTGQSYRNARRTLLRRMKRYNGK